MRLLLTIISILTLISCKQKTEKKERTNLEVSTQVETKSIKVDEERLEVSEKTYSLNDTKIVLTQTKGNGREFYCKTKLLIINDSKVIDSLEFTPEPVGGDYGISRPIEVDNHLIFTKHGDYDGRTIIINNKGQVFNIIGGISYFDKKNKLLFTIHESDLSGIAVFDLTTDSLKFEISELEIEPTSFHMVFENRYFFNAINNDLEKVIWEIEFDLDRIIQVDLDTNDINQDNVLKTWNMEEVSCECEK
jgi:hypothetical protein